MIVLQLSFGSSDHFVIGKKLNHVDKTKQFSLSSQSFFRGIYPQSSPAKLAKWMRFFWHDEKALGASAIVVWQVPVLCWTLKM